MPDEVLTIKEVAERLKLAEKTVYAMANAAELPAFKIRGQ
jgi:excisionase family DNA binding protein